MKIRLAMRWIIKIGLAGLCFMLGLIGYLFYVASHHLPDYTDLDNYQYMGMTRIYDAAGGLIAEYAREKRVVVNIDKIPQRIIHSFLSSEDKNFYKHQGIDFWGLARLPFVNIAKLINKERMQGASTITQQVVKNLLLSNEYSIMRKIKEAILSYKISHDLSKDQILELYLNYSYLGKGSYGVASAAKIYFNKSLEDLTLSEAAFLAALPKSPSLLSSPKYYPRALARREYVLNAMLKNGYITQEEMAEALKEDLNIHRPKAQSLGSVGYFCEAIREEITRMMGERTFYGGGLSIFTSLDPDYQAQAEKALRKQIDDFESKQNIKPYAHTKNWQEFERLKFPNSDKQMICRVEAVSKKFITVLTKTRDKITLSLEDYLSDISHIADKDFVRISEQNPNTLGMSQYSDTRKRKVPTSFQSIFKIGDVIVVKAKDNTQDNNTGYVLDCGPGLNGGIVVMNYTTGQILAMVGGYSFEESKFNRATQAQRQIGSLVKAFIYLAALEHNIEPNDIFSDGPFELTVGNTVWRPKNYGGNFLGNISMQTAFERSRNLVTLRISQKIGISSIVEILKRFSIHPNPPPFLPIALGAVESSLLRITSAFGTIANDSIRIQPTLINLIKDQGGNIIYKNINANCHGCQNLDSSPEIVQSHPHKRISGKASSYQIKTLLNGVMEYGTGRRVKDKFKLMTLAGKTGTTNDSKDVWFVGFSADPKIVVGTYLGYDAPKSLGGKVTGSGMALPIFADFMSYVYNNWNKKTSGSFLPDDANIFLVKQGKEYIKTRKQPIQHYSNMYLPRIYAKGSILNNSIFDFDSIDLTNERTTPLTSDVEADIFSNLNSESGFKNISNTSGYTDSDMESEANAIEELEAQNDPNITNATQQNFLSPSSLDAEHDSLLPHKSIIDGLENNPDLLNIIEQETY